MTWTFKGGTIQFSDATGCYIAINKSGYSDLFTSFKEAQLFLIT